MPALFISVAVIAASLLSIMAARMLHPVSFISVSSVYSVIPVPTIFLLVFVFIPNFFSISTKFARVTLASVKTHSDAVAHHGRRHRCSCVVYALRKILSPHQILSYGEGRLLPRGRAQLRSHLNAPASSECPTWWFS